jgi:hypothetical protein
MEGEFGKGNVPCIIVIVTCVRVYIGVIGLIEDTSCI